MKLKKIIVVGLITMMSALMVGCGKSSDKYKDVAVKDIESKVAEAIGADNYLPYTEIDATYLEEVYGVKEDSYKEFYGKIPRISTNVDTIIIVKVNDNKVNEVKKAFENYQTVAKENLMKYPMNIQKIENSVVIVYGNYVSFIQLGGDSSFNADTEEEEKAFVEVENKKASDAIYECIKQ